MSTWVTNSIAPVLTSITALASSMFSQDSFKALLIAVLGLSVMGLILGLIKR